MGKRERREIKSVEFEIWKLQSKNNLYIIVLLTTSLPRNCGWVGDCVCSCSHVGGGGYGMC
jgi:hypothetical protein